MSKLIEDLTELSAWSVADDPVWTYERVAKIARSAIDALTRPVPMRLTCPECGELHVDEGEFATKPHHTHACQHCGAVWRPAIIETVGVRFLPGFKSP
jgi:predicted RNA-binding Zn-ribbon protein involved in translation (DUF1610 family)